MKRACILCDYFYRTEPNQINKRWSECRKYPPKMVTDMDNPLHTTWPEVLPDEWCGEFKKRE